MAAVAFTKTDTDLALIRLAQRGDDAASALYAKVMTGWRQRSRRTVMHLDLNDAERTLLQDVHAAVTS